MSWRRVITVIATTLLATIVGITASQCVEQTSCSCHFPDGSFYDLSKLSAAGRINGSANNYTWSFQPCKNVKMTLLKDDKAASECNNGTGVSLCAQSLQVNSSAFSLGNTMETKWDITNVKEPRLILSHGTNSTEIMLVCCETCPTTTFNMDIPPSATKFHYLLASPHVCKVHAPSEGLSTGSVLVILLFVFSGVYLLIGALALRFFRGAIGWELIPNYDFWSDLPALVRDGVAFTFSGCSAESYDRI